MELLVKPEMLTSYIYGPTFGNAETISFYCEGHQGASFLHFFCRKFLFIFMLATCHAHFYVLDLIM